VRKTHSKIDYKQTKTLEQKHLNKMLKILCLILILISTAIVSASRLQQKRALRANSRNYKYLSKRYDILRRIAKPPSIKEIQAKHELQRLRLIRGEPIDGTPTKKTYLQNQRNKK
jgi:hypothetical protein